jgi:hypothetical protein
MNKRQRKKLYARSVCHIWTYSGKVTATRRTWRALRIGEVVVANLGGWPAPRKPPYYRRHEWGARHQDYARRKAKREEQR